MHELWPLLLSPDAPELGVTYFIKGVERVRGGRSRNLEHLARVLRNTVWNRETLYVNINPSSHNSHKGKSSDVTHWNHVLLDIDPQDVGADPALSCAHVEAQLEGLGFANCYSIIDSGRGMQIWLALTPLKLDASLRPRVEYATTQFIRGLECKHGCVIDTSCSDLSRVARPPGSYNQKSGRTATLVRAATSIAVPEQILELADRWVQPVAPQPLTKSSNLNDVLAHLTETAATFICEGYREPGRHKAAYATARNLKELGVGIDKARAWLLRGARLSTPQLNDIETERALQNAYKKE